MRWYRDLFALMVYGGVFYALNAKRAFFNAQIKKKG